MVGLELKTNAEQPVPATQVRVQAIMRGARGVPVLDVEARGADGAVLPQDEQGRDRPRQDGLRLRLQALPVARGGQHVHEEATSPTPRICTARLPERRCPAGWQFNRIFLARKTTPKLAQETSPSAFDTRKIGIEKDKLLILNISSYVTGFFTIVQ